MEDEKFPDEGMDFDVEAEAFRSETKSLRERLGAAKEGLRPDLFARVVKRIHRLSDDEVDRLVHSKILKGVIAVKEGPDSLFETEYKPSYSEESISRIKASRRAEAEGRLIRALVELAL